VQFGFPDGVSVRAIADDIANSELHEIQFGSLSKLEDSDHSFVFLVTGSNLTLYGFCVVQNELLSVVFYLPSTHHPSLTAIYLF